MANANEPFNSISLLKGLCIVLVCPYIGLLLKIMMVGKDNLSLHSVQQDICLSFKCILGRKRNAEYIKYTTYRYIFIAWLNIMKIGQIEN